MVVVAFKMPPASLGEKNEHPLPYCSTFCPFQTRKKKIKGKTISECKWASSSHTT